MNDRSWMLNPQAIRIAKDCIQHVKEELGVKLLLSHPDFVQMLHEYVELTESQALAEAYTKLIAFAGPGTIVQSLSKKQDKTKVVPIKQKAVANGDIPTLSNEEEMVEFRGRQFPRFRDGREFNGMYRGQPIYS